MLAEHPTADPARGDDRGRLRAATLRLGALLGWQAHEVEAFAEALTGRSWTECGCAELGRVFDEYHEVALAIAARMGRRGARRRRGDGYADRG
jgi:hypothetical protein